MNRVAITIVGVLLCAGMFLLSAYIQHLIPGIVQSGAPISTSMSIAIGLAHFWARFWWFLIPMVFGALFSIDFIVLLSRGEKKA
jgi:hypothetical protein